MVVSFRDDCWAKKETRRGRRTHRPTCLADRDLWRSGGGGEPVLDRPTGPLDRLRSAGHDELRVGEEQGGLDLEGELRRILPRVDRTLGLGVADGGLEL